MAQQQQQQQQQDQHHAGQLEQQHIELNQHQEPVQLLHQQLQHESTTQQNQQQQLQQHQQQLEDSSQQHHFTLNSSDKHQLTLQQHDLSNLQQHSADSFSMLTNFDMGCHAVDTRGLDLSVHSLVDSRLTLEEFMEVDDVTSGHHHEHDMAKFTKIEESEDMIF